MNQVQDVISRRRVVGLLSYSAASALSAGRPLFASEDGIVPTMVNAARIAKINTHKLRRDVTVLEGSGGNIAVLTGRDGKLLVDAGFTVSRAALVEALAAISPHPVRNLINTHWHTDHTDGNEWLHSSGATITAHENTKKHLSRATRVEGWNFTFPAAPAGALPTTLVTTKHQMRVNDTHIVVKPYPPAHTDSDLSVHFTEADVFHTGDTWWNGVYPFIDYSTGGNIDGSIRAAEANVAAVGSRTIVIPGHGAIGGKSDLTEFRDMLVDIRNKVAALKKQGRSLKDVVTAKPTAAHDAKWGKFLITPAMFTALVYSGV